MPDLITLPSPNIVFIITDQQRFDTLAAAGFGYMITPNLDRLAREGVLFTSMYVTAPSCAPSRASLFTGLYPHTTGVFRNDERWTHTWVQQLADSGYHTVNVGKMHTSPFEAPYGFHERHVTENKDRAHPALPYFLDNWDKAVWSRGYEKPSRVTYRRRDDYRTSLGAFVWNLPADLHSDNFVPNLAAHWLDTWRGAAPFFLQVGFPGPHPPYDPTQDSLDLYAGRPIPMPVVDRASIDAEPAPLKRLRQQHLDTDHDAVVHLDDATEAQQRRQREHYYANVTMIDTQVGNLIDALDRRGVLADTVIIFTSDHGDCLGDHGHSQKWTMYEESVHVPAIVWSPGRVAAGRTVDDLVSLFDLGPTVLELAGLQPPRYMEARSLLPYLTDAAADPRRYVFAEHANDMILQGTEFMTMIRDTRWKLVHFVDSNEGQLFDLYADPGELRTLWDDPAHEAVKRALVDEILKWRIRSDLHTQGWTEAVRATGGM
jgi:arylsulfatase